MTTPPRRIPRTLVWLVAVSAALRVVLCRTGGQYFMGDEDRFDRGVRLFMGLCRGDLQGAAQVLALPEHALFTWLTAAATGCQRLLTLAGPNGDWGRHPEHAAFSVWVAAAVLSLASAASIGLVYAVARRVGASQEEALWAAALAAASNTLFYYSRHLVPYDSALCAALGSLALGLGDVSSRRAAWSGLLAAATYQLYNGYWFLPVCVVVLLGASWRGLAGRSRRWRGFAAGAAAGAAIPWLVGTLAGGGAYWRTMLAFSGTVKQGSFSEGWSLPWEYLWHSEGSLGAAVLAAIAVSVHLARREGRALPALARLGLGGAALCLVLLAAMSTGAHVFVVYARSVRPAVPFLCLAGGWALAGLARGRALPRAALALGIAGCAACAFAGHFTRVFPRQFEVSVLRRYGNVKHTLSVSGSIYQELALPIRRPDLALVNAQLLYPVRAPVGFPRGRTLESHPHPLEYLPFQYEGFTPRERAILRSTDISMRLIRLDDPSSLPDELPPALRFGPGDRATGN